MSAPNPPTNHPFAELHRHLDGSLRSETLFELAESIGVSVPEPFGFYPGMGLRRALDCFDITLSVLKSPEHVERVAREMCEDARLDQTSHLEIRFAPQLHGTDHPELFVDAALSGIKDQATLILCGLYGESPAIFERLVDLARNRPRVVGLDLAGAPQAQDQWGMEDYVPAFQKARELGLGRTVHAGEGRPPQEIRQAIELLGAQRIGHGTSLLDDPDVLELVLERHVTIEACITSNLQTSVISSIEAHPLPKWLKYGVKACICTDNTLLSDVTLLSEYRQAAALPMMTSELIEHANMHGHQAAFPIR